MIPLDIACTLGSSYVPEISRFLGIVIAMFYREHGPPHFHASYSGYRITVEIESGSVTGVFPRRALAHVQEWRELHISELLEDWRLASERKPMNKIPPLE
jgi:Domain of unknown function (DUF4160)